MLKQKKMVNRAGLGFTVQPKEHTMNPETKLVQLLIKINKKITTAESCTGGMIASSIVNVADASKVFDAGFVTYADFAKTNLLNVSPELIMTHGVVSESVARAMAEGACAASGASIAISTTGVAGPGGGTEETPVGTVCFGYTIDSCTRTETIVFAGDRNEVRKKACTHALDKLLELLGEN